MRLINDRRTTSVHVTSHFAPTKACNEAGNGRQTTCVRDLTVCAN